MGAEDAPPEHPKEDIVEEQAATSAKVEVCSHLLAPLLHGIACELRSHVISLHFATGAPRDHRDRRVTHW